MFVSIIIPHWNGKQHLDDCLTSLRTQTHRDFEVLLVDNGSTDGSFDYTNEHFPEVRWVGLPSNRGFTGACLAGWRVAKGEIIILLNNDTAVEANWLAEVIAAFKRHPQAGSVASKMLLFDERNKIHTAGDFVRVDGLPGNRGVWCEDAGEFNTETPVFSACGGSAAYRRTMLDEIGFLDNDYFFSCEDVDLGWRAQLSGWQVIYVPTAIVYHKLKATGGNETASFYDGRNFLYLLAKNYPTSLFRKQWRTIFAAQAQITREALKHWRGKAAQQRLKGQLAGLLTLPKMLRKRRTIHSLRRVSDAYLLSILSPINKPVDETD